jgi:FtsZ-interacting cell division protein ZipA
LFKRQEEADKRRAEMRAAMKNTDAPAASQVEKQVEKPVEPVQEPVKAEMDDIPLPTSKPKTGGEAPSWEEYMKQIQEEEAKNPTPVETKPAVTRKPAVTKKAEAKPADPEEEEKKKKRYDFVKVLPVTPLERRRLRREELK